jgi:hypothetical protein
MEMEERGDGEELRNWLRLEYESGKRSDGCFRRLCIYIAVVESKGALALMILLANLLRRSALFETKIDICA